MQLQCKHTSMLQMSQPFVLMKKENILLIIFADTIESVLRTGTVAITQETFKSNQLHYKYTHG